MVEDQDQRKRNFVDLVDYHEKRKRMGPRGNIIKAARIVRSGSEQVVVASEVGVEPTVLLHKDGDRVVAVEFLCKCGRSTTVHLSYEQE